MLYLNRKPGEAVIINHSIEVRVVEVRGKTVKLGFSFPPEATVLREEIFEPIKQANQAALEAMRALPPAAGEPDADVAASATSIGTAKP